MLTQYCTFMLCGALAAFLTSPPAHVTIGEHNGTPTFFIDGKPEAPVFIYQTKLTDKEPAQFRAQGYRLFSFVGNMGTFGMSIGWTGENQYDYGEFDTELKAFAERVPDGYCIPRVWVAAPKWWMEKQPEESVRFANGAEWKDNEWGGTVHESFASQRWRREGGEAFRRFIRHILASPYADRVVGIHVAGGIYGEWHGWSAPDMPDTSEPMRQAFIRFANAKYANNIETLRTAWHEKVEDFDSITIPTRQEQLATDVGMFRDPSRRRRVIDYYECMHEECVDDIEHFCRIVKEESHARLLTQVFYGYLPDLPWPVAGDHRAGPRALQIPLIDIVVSPHTYTRRHPGEDGLFRHFPASDILHGKLFLDEGDDCTYLAPPNWPAKFVKTREQSIQLMRREFGNVVTHGVGMYFMDMSGTFFSEPELMAELGRIKKWADRSMDLPRKSVAQVAVISCLRSEFYTAGHDTRENQITLALYNQQIGELRHTGAPFDLYHIDDLPLIAHRPYKVHVFLDAFYLTEPQIAAIETLKSNHRTLLWFYAPGFITPQSLSLETMQSLTGFAFEQSDASKLQVSLDSKAFPEGPLLFGFDPPQSPIFIPTDAAAKVWGRSRTTQQPALVAKDMGSWRSIYCENPPLPSTVLRRIFAEAGVHIYCETCDNLSANASWISLHTIRAGKKTIRLPRPATVYDVVADREVASNSLSFEQDMAAAQTGIWMLKLSAPDSQ